MKVLPIGAMVGAALCVIGFSDVCAQGLSRENTNKLKTSKLEGARELPAAVKKIGGVYRVLQVLPEGLLMAGNEPWLLKGFPDLINAVDGQSINCFIQKAPETFKYVTVMGSESTIRVFVYVKERKGR